MSTYDEAAAAPAAVDRDLEPQTVEAAVADPAAMQEVQDLPPPALEQHKRRKQKRYLRGGYGWGALVLAGVQVGVTDWGFFKYGTAKHWNVDAQVMDVWLGAAVDAGDRGRRRDHQEHLPLRE